MAPVTYSLSSSGGTAPKIAMRYVSRYLSHDAIPYRDTYLAGQSVLFAIAGVATRLLLVVTYYNQLTTDGEWRNQLHQVMSQKSVKNNKNTHVARYVPWAFINTLN